MLSVDLLQACQGVPHRRIGQALQHIEQFSDGSIAIMAELLHHTRSCTASCYDTQVDVQLCNAVQPTDEWAFFSRIGFKGPVTKAVPSLFLYLSLFCLFFFFKAQKSNIYINFCQEKEGQTYQRTDVVASATS